MATSILVGLDGPPADRPAIDFAIQLARRDRAVVRGVAVLDEPGICSGHAMPIGGSHYQAVINESHLSDAEKSLRDWMAAFTAAATAAGAESAVELIVGDPPAVLAREAQRVDLVVLAARPQFRFATQAEPDDTATAVVRNSPRPVAVVPAAAPLTDAVLVAYDGSLQAAQALGAARAAGLLAGRTVHLAALDTDGHAAAHLGRAEDYLSRHGVAARPHVLPPAGAIGPALLAEARAVNAGMIIMGAYGRSSLAEFFLGSVTKSMLDSSPLPLVLSH